MRYLLVLFIRVYRLTLSKVFYAVLGPLCRFEPTCSVYAMQAITGHGALRGSLLSVKRLCRCHPFHPGGYDPPPPPRSSTGRLAPGPSPSSDPATAASPADAGPPLSRVPIAASPSKS